MCLRWTQAPATGLDSARQWLRTLPSIPELSVVHTLTLRWNTREDPARWFPASSHFISLLAQEFEFERRKKQLWEAMGHQPPEDNTTEQELADRYYSAMQAVLHGPKEDILTGQVSSPGFRGGGFFAVSTRCHVHKQASDCATSEGSARTHLVRCSSSSVCRTLPPPTSHVDKYLNCR